MAHWPPRCSFLCHVRFFMVPCARFISLCTSCFMQRECPPPPSPPSPPNPSGDLPAGGEEGGGELSSSTPLASPPPAHKSGASPPPYTHPRPPPISTRPPSSTLSTFLNALCHPQRRSPSPRPPTSCPLLPQPTPHRAATPVSLFMPCLLDPDPRTTDPRTIHANQEPTMQRWTRQKGKVRHLHAKHSRAEQERSPSSCRAVGESPRSRARPANLS